MSKLQFKGNYRQKTGEHQFELSIYSFTDDGCRIIYSPALDVSGYGKNISEAKNSFEESLEEFVRYTTNKGTLLKELRKLGWIIKAHTSKIPKKITAPRLADQLLSNEYLANIFETKEFKKFSESVSLPV